MSGSLYPGPPPVGCASRMPGVSGVCCESLSSGSRWSIGGRRPPSIDRPAFASVHRPHAVCCVFGPRFPRYPVSSGLRSGSAILCPDTRWQLPRCVPTASRRQTSSRRPIRRCRLAAIVDGQTDIGDGCSALGVFQLNVTCQVPNQNDAVVTSHRSPSVLWGCLRTNCVSELKPKRLLLSLVSWLRSPSPSGTTLDRTGIFTASVGENRFDQPRLQFQRQLADNRLAQLEGPTELDQHVAFALEVGQPISPFLMARRWDRQAFAPSTSD